MKHLFFYGICVITGLRFYDFNVARSPRSGLSQQKSLRVPSRANGLDSVGLELTGGSKQVSRSLRYHLSSFARRVLCCRAFVFSS